MKNLKYRMNNYLYAISKTFSTLPSSVGGGACGFNWIGSGGGEATWRGGRGGGGSCRFTWIVGGGGTCTLTWVPGGGGGVIAAVSRLTGIGGIGGGGGGGGGGGADALEVGPCAICMLPLTVEVAFPIDPELTIKKKRISATQTQKDGIGYVS